MVQIMSGWSHDEAKQHTVRERLHERCASYAGLPCYRRGISKSEWCERCLAAELLLEHEQVMEWLRSSLLPHMQPSPPIGSPICGTLWKTDRYRREHDWNDGEDDYDDEDYTPPTPLTRRQKLHNKINGKLVAWGLRPNNMSQFERVLAEQYLPIIREQLNNDTLLLNKIGANTRKLTRIERLKSFLRHRKQSQYQAETRIIATKHVWQSGI